MSFNKTRLRKHISLLFKNVKNLSSSIDLCRRNMYFIEKFGGPKEAGYKSKKDFFKILKLNTNDLKLFYKLYKAAEVEVALGFKPCSLPQLLKKN